MIAITRDKKSGRVVLTTHGELDDTTVNALLEAIRHTEEEAPIVLDLADAGMLKAEHETGFLSALAFRSGPVAVRGAHRHHRHFVSVIRACASH